MEDLHDTHILWNRRNNASIVQNKGSITHGYIPDREGEMIPFKMENMTELYVTLVECAKRLYELHQKYKGHYTSRRYGWTGEGELYGGIDGWKSDGLSFVDDGRSLCLFLYMNRVPVLRLVLNKTQPDYIPSCSYIGNSYCTSGSIAVVKYDDSVRIDEKLSEYIKKAKIHGYESFSVYTEHDLNTNFMLDILYHFERKYHADYD